MGINYDGTNAQVLARCNQIINDRGVDGRHHHDQSGQRGDRRPRQPHHDHRLRTLRVERHPAAVVLQRPNAHLLRTTMVKE